MIIATITSPEPIDRFAANMENQGAQARGIENKKCKFVWDFSAQTDHETHEKQRDISSILNKINGCQIIDFAYPCDGRVDTKEFE